MKYYKLAKDLPTFEKGELFYTDDSGNLCRVKDDMLAYHHTTVSKFPDMLGDWFVEVPAPERDSKTKHAFMEYLSDHREERFFQAIRNFTCSCLNTKGNGIGKPFIIASDLPPKAIYEEDTFYWECDEMLKDGDEIQS